MIALPQAAFRMCLTVVSGGRNLQGLRREGGTLLVILKQILHLKYGWNLARDGQAAFVRINMN
jgi:hypothetical protein